MTEQFKKGEIAIIVAGEHYDFPEDAKYDGEECTILSFHPETDEDHEHYFIDTAFGPGNIRTRHLRKKKLPSHCIAETREKGAPSFNDMIIELNREMVK